MKANVKLLVLGIFFLLLPRIYYHLVSQEISATISLLALISALVGVALIIKSFVKKEYKISDIKMGKIFEVKSIYLTPWGCRVGINFEGRDKRYFISPTPKELKGLSCKTKYQKTKKGIVKI